MRVAVSQLSGLSRFFLCFLGALWVVTTIFVPVMGLIVPGLGLPTALYICWAKRYPLEFDQVVRLYGAGFLPYALLTMLVELVLVMVFAMMCFPEQVPNWIDQLQRSQTPDIPTEKTVGLFIFLILMAFVVAALTEEGMKYRVISNLKRQRPEFNHWGGYLIYAMAPAIGFSTAENIGYVSNQKTKESMALAALQRLLLSTPLHCLTGYILGLGIVRKEIFGENLAWYRVMFPAVLCHGLFGYIQFLTSYLEETSWWTIRQHTDVVAALGAVVCMLLFAAYAYRERRKLVSQYQLNDSYAALLPVEPNADAPTETGPEDEVV